MKLKAEIETETHMENDDAKQYHINFEGYRSVTRDPRISRSARLALVILLSYAGVNNRSFPSEDTLATNLGYKSSRQVRNVIKELEQQGLLTKERGGFGRSNRYYFSKEIYFPIDNSSRQSTSAYSGNRVPQESGNPVPTNVVSESGQLKHSHLEHGSQKNAQTPYCGKCEQGYIYVGNSAIECNCKKEAEGL